MAETTVDSFIIRFIREHGPGTLPAPGPWHGVIRHVQSNQQIRFTQIEDALRFVGNYVDFAGSSPTEAPEGEGR
jgi:hypothetical protein